MTVVFLLEVLFLQSKPVPYRTFNLKTIINKKLLIPSNKKIHTYNSLYTLMKKN